MRRRTAVIGSLLVVLVLLLATAGAIAIWRIPLAEAVIAAYVERTYGVPLAITIGEIDTSSARIDHVKLGHDAPFEARDIRLAYSDDFLNWTVPEMLDLSPPIAGEQTRDPADTGRAR